MKVTNVLNMDSNKIINLGVPISGTDAASKAYVDASAQGYKGKEPVRVMSTADIDLTGALFLPFNGVALVTGDRVLLKDQFPASENGIYVLLASGLLARATDFDASSEITGATVAVIEGTVGSGSLWLMTTPSPVLGTTALTFIQTNAGTTYTAGVGIDSNQLSNGVIKIDTSTVAQKYAMQIGDGVATEFTIIPSPFFPLWNAAVYVTEYFGLGNAKKNVIADISHETDGSVKITFPTPPTAGQYFVTVVG
jgi:hypothetical protein